MITAVTGAWSSGATVRTPAVQIGERYLAPEMFLLKRNDTAIANLWMPQPWTVLYHRGHWPHEYVDSDGLEPTALPT